MTTSDNGHVPPDSTPYSRLCHRPGCGNWFGVRDKPGKLYCSKACQERAAKDRYRERRAAREQGVSIEDVEPAAAIELPALVRRAVESDWDIPEETRAKLPGVMSALASSEDERPQDRVAATRAVIAMREQQLKLLQIVAQSEQQEQQPPERPQTVINVTAMQNVLASRDACIALEVLQEQIINQAEFR